MILNKFKNIQNKNISCRIQEQLQNGYIKLYGNENTKLGKYSNINFLLDTEKGKNSLRKI